MIDEELLNKFDRIQDLPVSEEMLGAYMEDNLSPTEALDVESAIQEYNYLKDIIYPIAEYDTKIDDISIDSAISEFELPNIPDDSYIELDLEYSSSLPELEFFDSVTTDCTVDNVSSHEDCYTENTIENQFEDDDALFDSSDDNDISDYE